MVGSLKNLIKMCPVGEAHGGGNFRNGQITAD